MATPIITLRSVPVLIYRGGQLGADLATPIGRMRYEPQSTYRGDQILGPIFDGDTPRNRAHPNPDTVNLKTHRQIKP